MSWVEVYNQSLTRGASGAIASITLQGMTTRRVVISCVSISARVTWDKACDLVMLVQYPVSDAPLLEFYRKVIPLNQSSAIDLPFYRPAQSYTIRLDIPYWFADITVKVWAGVGEDDPLQWEGVRSPGFLQFYSGVPSATGYLLDCDGYWVCLSLDNVRTIGRTQSGASVAQTWLEKLFEHLWNSYSNSRCPVLSSTGVAVGRGASAQSDWLANCRITLPDCRGRSLLVSGTGSNLTSRYKGDLIGTENHTLTINEMPTHRHNLSGAVVEQLSGAFYTRNNSGVHWRTTNVTDVAGGGLAHNNMPPVAVEHLFISAGSR